MIRRFETFVTAIAQISRCIQKLKSQEMAHFDLKGTHVMCLFHLSQHPEGLTVSQLAQLCDEDKAAVSRAIGELRVRALVSAPDADASGRRYRAAITLTDEGRAVAQQMDRKIIRAVDAAAHGYSEQERAVFYRVLLQIAENLQHECAQKEDADS